MPQWDDSSHGAGNNAVMDGGRKQRGNVRGTVGAGAHLHCVSDPWRVAPQCSATSYGVVTHATIEMRDRMD